MKWEIILELYKGEKKDREREKEMWIPTSTTNENDEAWKWLK